MDGHSLTRVTHPDCVVDGVVENLLDSTSKDVCHDGVLACVKLKVDFCLGSDCSPSVDSIGDDGNNIYELWCGWLLRSGQPKQVVDKCAESLNFLCGRLYLRGVGLVLELGFEVFEAQPQSGQGGA